MEQVRRGKAWGALVFASNYSASLIERTEAGQFADDWTLEASDVTVRLDMSSKFIFVHLISFINSFKFYRSTNWNSSLARFTVFLL